MTSCFFLAGVTQALTNVRIMEIAEHDQHARASQSGFQGANPFRQVASIPPALAYAMAPSLAIKPPGKDSLRRAFRVGHLRRGHRAQSSNADKTECRDAIHIAISCLVSGVEATLIEDEVSTTM